MKPPQEGRNRGAPSLRGLQGRSATGLNGQAAKDEVSAVWRGLDAGKYFWRSGREKCFSLDIPSPETYSAELWIKQSGFRDRKSTRLNSSHLGISYAVF